MLWFRVGQKLKCGDAFLCNTVWVHNLRRNLHWSQSILVYSLEYFGFWQSLWLFGFWQSLWFFGFWQSLWFFGSPCCRNWCGHAYHNCGTRLDIEHQPLLLMLALTLLRFSQGTSDFQSVASDRVVPSRGSGWIVRL